MVSLVEPGEISHRRCVCAGPWNGGQEVNLRRRWRKVLRQGNGKQVDSRIVNSGLVEIISPT